MTRTSSRPKAPHERGELQRRVDAIIATGVLGTLPRTALVAFVQLRQWADFTTCATRPTSIRTLAKHARVPRTAAWKGVQKLLESGAMTADVAGDDGRRIFTFRVPTRRTLATQTTTQRRRPPCPRGV
jgi:hypothetical protein